jgi:hypothetical protein
MIPIEYVFVLLWLLFGMVGLARRFPKEIGATIGFVAMLLMFALADKYLEGLLVKMMQAIGLSVDAALAQWFVYTIGIAMWVGFMYIGQTLSFAGTWPPGPLIGKVMDILAGLLNGWLVVGTWWYYTNVLGYPIQKLGWYVPPLSAQAQRWVSFTPPAIVPDQYSIVILGGLLVLMIGLRVVR